MHSVKKSRLKGSFPYIRSKSTCIENVDTKVEQ
jgi:hypothetical protein